MTSGKQIKMTEKPNDEKVLNPMIIDTEKLPLTSDITADAKQIIDSCQKMAYQAINVAW